MKSNFRQVFVFNLDVETKKKPAVLPSMDEIISVLEKRRLAGSTVMPLSNGDAHIILGDIVRDDPNKIVTLLFRHSDKHSAESVYSNVASGMFTAHPKALDDGGETGAHLLISTAPEKGIPGRYTCLLEKAQSLDASVIRRFINRLLHDEYDTNLAFFSYDSPTGQRDRAGQVVRERTLPRVELDGQPSQTLARDVQQGRLTGITLRKAVVRTPVGGVPFLHQREATMQIDIDQGALTSNIWGDVKRALKAEAQAYPTAQIGIRLPGRKKMVSVRVDSATGAPLTDLYVKSFDIWNISPPMASSSKTIVPTFVDRVRQYLIDERLI